MTARLARVVRMAGGYAFPLRVSFDPQKHRKYRTRQKVELARYARQDVFSWDHRPVRELDDFHEALCDLLEREAKKPRNPEDA